MQFRAGDKVKCIDNSLAKDYFVLGEPFIIDRVPYADYVCFDHTGHIAWCADRFELIEKENTMQENSTVVSAKEQSKQFNPNPGDKIICMNGEEYTCCTLEYLQENIVSEIYSTKPIFGFRGNSDGWQDWYDSGKATSSNMGDKYDIQKVIPKQKEETPPEETEVKQELTFTVEDIRKACIDDLGWVEYSFDLLVQSLKKVTHPEYDEYIRLKAIFESEEE